MVTNPLFPAWLVWGLLFGGAFALLALGAFLAGERLVPSRGDRERGEDGRDPAREGGETRRHGEIADYLTAIGEAYETDREIDGHAVAFYLPDREVAVTFDAKAFLGLQDSRVTPVLCEHEMPGAFLGSRLPFETPDVEPDPGTGAAGDGDGAGPRWAGGSYGHASDRWRARRAYWDGEAGTTGRSAVGDGAGTDRRAVEDSFATLGLPPDADREAVREAYRDQVKEVHPDHGGDREAFRRLQDAYATAREHAD